MVNLIWEETVKDEDCFNKKVPHCVSAYVLREKSVTRAETYDSMRAGVSTKIVLEIRTEDWEQTRHIVNEKTEYARKAEYNGCTYDIVRIYKVGKSKVEVICG